MLFSSKCRSTNYEIHRRILIPIIILFCSCDYPDDCQVETNLDPVLEDIYFQNTLIINNLIDYNTNYTLRCNAEDPEDNDLTYNWYFTKKQFRPFVWKTIVDTFLMYSDTISYRINSTGDFMITCEVHDKNGGSAALTESYRIGLPEDLWLSDWKLDKLFSLNDTTGISVDEEYSLNIEPDSYFGMISPYNYKFGEILLFNDTLSFATEFDGPRYENDYTDTLGIYDLWSLLEVFTYRYEVHEDTLQFFFSLDTMGVVVFQFKSYR